MLARARGPERDCVGAATVMERISQAFFQQLQL
jgi:hypothetical protein